MKDKIRLAVEAMEIAKQEVLSGKVVTCEIKIDEALTILKSIDPQDDWKSDIDTKGKQEALSKERVLEILLRIDCELNYVQAANAICSLAIPNKDSEELKEIEKLIIANDNLLNRAEQGEGRIKQLEAELADKKSDAVEFAEWLHKFYPNAYKEYPHPKYEAGKRGWDAAFGDTEIKPASGTTEELYQEFLKSKSNNKG